MLAANVGGSTLAAPFFILPADNKLGGARPQASRPETSNGVRPAPSRRHFSPSHLRVRHKLTMFLHRAPRKFNTGYDRPHSSAQR